MTGSLGGGGGPMPPGSLNAGNDPAKPVPPTAPGAHDGGLEYGVIAPDVAADNMAAHIATMPEDLPSKIPSLLREGALV